MSFRVPFVILPLLLPEIVSIEDGHINMASDLCREVYDLPVFQSPGLVPVSCERSPDISLASVILHDSKVFKDEASELNIRKGLYGFPSAWE